MLRPTTYSITEIAAFIRSPTLIGALKRTAAAAMSAAFIGLRKRLLSTSDKRGAR